MKNSKAKKTIISAIVLTIILSTLFVVLIPTSAASMKGTAIRPIGYGDISTEDYYRLLYSNDSLGETVEYDFEKQDYEFDNFDLNDDILKELGAANIAIKALGAIPFMPKFIISTAGTILQTKSMYRINQNTSKMMNQLGENLEDVYNSLSKEIDNQTQILSKDISDAALYLSNQMESDKCITALKDFNEKAFNGKGYGAWKKELLSAYNQLVFYNTSLADQSDVKEAYDRLFVVASNYTVLASFITANESVEDDSIQDILFRYYLLRSLKEGDITLDQAVNECVSFAEELYTTYIFSELCMNICFRYQLEKLQEEYGTEFETKGYLISETVNTIDRRISYYETIKPFVENESQRLDAIVAEISKHYVKVLNLAESYSAFYEGTYNKVIYNELVEGAVINSHTVTRNGAADTEKHIVTNNSVSVNEVIHLNTLPQNLVASFETKYTFVSSNNDAATVTSTGVVTVKKNEAFKISLLYGDYLVYEMSFVPATLFSGGDGTEHHPFILSNLDDINKLANDPELWAKGYHYRLTTDINTNYIPKIGSTSTSFEGVFDGNGHIISGLQNSLFGVNNGTIKNLVIKGSSVTSGGSAYNTRLVIACVCDYNNGVIENVHLKNSQLSITNRNALNVSSGGASYYVEVSLYVGGITGYSTGVVKRCSVDSVSIKGYQENGTASGLINEIGAPHSNIISMGNIVGRNTGEISDCLATNNNNYSYIKSVSAFNNYVGIKTEYLCVAYFEMGGLVGNNSGTVERSIAYSNNSSYDWAYDTINNVTWLAKKKYIQDKNVQISGLVSKNSSNVNMCYDSVASINGDDMKKLESAGWSFGGNTATIKNTSAKTIIVYKNPMSIMYSKDGVLNVAGLVLKTDTGEYITDGYAVKEGSVSPNGQKVVSISWNGYNTSFEISTMCGHQEQRLESTSNEYDKKLVCNQCDIEIVYLEGYSAPLYVNHDHMWDSGNIVKHPTHDEDGRKVYNCIECGARYDEVLFALTDHLYNQKRQEDRYLASPKVCTENAYYYYICICGEVGTETYAGNVVSHIVGAEIYFNEASHWNKCTICGDRANEHEHMFGVWNTTTPAESGNNGEKVRTCYECGYKDIAPVSNSGLSGSVSIQTIIIISVVVVVLILVISIVFMISMKQSMERNIANRSNNNSAANQSESSNNDNDSSKESNN